MMRKILDSYHEVGKIRPIFNRIRRVGFDIPYWKYRFNWWLVNKLHYVTPFPIHIDIESTNFCNLKCTMCPHSLGDFEMSKGYFDLNLYRKLVGEFKKHRLKSLKLNIRGEPLLNRKLADMVALAKAAGVLEVMFNTNGLLLTPERTRELITAGLDLLIVSIDGASADTYNRIRKGGDYNRLVENLEYFVQYRRKKKLSKPVLRLQFVEMDENTHEVEKYLNMWTGKADVLTVNRYSNRGCGDRQVFNMKPVGRTNCYHPWRRVSINWEGRLQMCCGDWQSRCVLGDVSDQTIHDLWHSKKYNAYRALLLKRKLDEIPCCKDCFVLASYIWQR